MTLLLAIETTVGPFSVALFEGKDLIGSYYHHKPHCQAELLIPSINNILSEHGYNYSDINAIAVSVGPGSFTGIRIGLSAAQGIALAIGCPIVGVGTLEAIATAGEKENYMVAITAGRDQYYSQNFSNTNGIIAATSTPHLISSAEAINSTDGNIVITDTHDSYPFLSAHRVGLKALEKIAQGEAIFNPSPIYIRDADAKLPTR